MLGREGLLPNWLAQVHPVSNTPVNATWLTGVSSGVLLFCPCTSSNQDPPQDGIHIQCADSSQRYDSNT